MPGSQMKASKAPLSKGAKLSPAGYNPNRDCVPLSTKRFGQSPSQRQRWSDTTILLSRTEML